MSKKYFVIDGYAFTGYISETKEAAEKAIEKIKKQPTLIGYPSNWTKDESFDPDDLYIEEVETTDSDDTTTYHYFFAMNGWSDRVCLKCLHIENMDVHVRLGWNYCPICGRKIVPESEVKK